ncbi:histidine kinase [Brevibacillus invocatus]|uniref:Histidine kinase n=2 Tax=Brevibacillus invocatus TaxID=173959 RepID=A0A3M8CG41_9BACL|nr:histidine kinase [Brevibacillus invocatus]
MDTPNYSNQSACSPLPTPKAARLTLSPDQLERIHQATTFRELSQIRQELLDLTPLHSLKRAGELAPFAVIVNLIQDHIIRQGVTLAVMELAKRGVGEPPFPFAFIQFGSGGRCEQALISDQDNGLIYQVPSDVDPSTLEKAHGYFHLLGATIVQGLEEVGYPPCQGNVTCVSLRWRGSIEQWLERLDGWAAHPIWENARYLLLASDARVLWGDSKLFTPVLERFRSLLANNPLLIGRLVSNTLHYRVSLGLFGRIIPEVQGRYRGAINLKYGVYLPIVNCVRHFALANGIFVSSTLERIALIREHGIWPIAFCDEVESHFRQLLGMRLVAPLHWQDGQYTSNSYIKLTELSPDSTVMTRTAMRLAIRLQRMTEKLPSVY